MKGAYTVLLLRISNDVYVQKGSPTILQETTLLFQIRKNHIPLNTIFYEKLYFKPGNLGYPVFETAFGKIGVIICHDRHYPEGARCSALNGAEIRLVPSATAEATT